VSQATVSIILNEAPAAQNFSEKTRQQVREAAEALGYRINPLARALRRKRSGVLGCVLWSHQDIYYARFVEIAETFARERGYDFVVTSMGYDLDRFETCLNQMMAWRAEGLLLMLGGRVLEQRLAERLKKNAVPYVIGDSAEPGQLQSAALFSYRSGQLLAEHLYTLGHRNFGVVGVHPSNLHSSERLRGATEFLAGVGVTIDQNAQIAIPEGKFGPEAGYECTEALLNCCRRFTALIALNDLLALGALAALRARGVVVPNDCSVAGFDDISLDYTGADQNRLGQYLAPPNSGAKQCAVSCPPSSKKRTSPAIPSKCIPGSSYANRPRPRLRPKRDRPLDSIARPPVQYAP